MALLSMQGEGVRVPARDDRELEQALNEIESLEAERQGLDAKIETLRAEAKAEVIEKVREWLNRAAVSPEELLEALGDGRRRQAQRQGSTKGTGAEKAFYRLPSGQVVSNRGRKSNEQKELEAQGVDLEKFRIAEDEVTGDKARQTSTNADEGER